MDGQTRYICPLCSDPLESAKYLLFNSFLQLNFILWYDMKVSSICSNDAKFHLSIILNECLCSALTAHIRAHNTVDRKVRSPGEVKVEGPCHCVLCGKRLSSQSSLDRHMLVHSGTDSI